jgi:glutamine amidotransferase
MIAVVNYGAGNIRSVSKALERAGAQVTVTDRPGEICKANKIVLPGVGSFGRAVEALENRGLIGPLRVAVTQGKPFLGICLGFQLLFETSHESRGVRGLGCLEGSVDRLPSVLKVPHLGWNRVRQTTPCDLWEGIPDPCYFYFAHSFFVKPDQDVYTAGTTKYGTVFTSAIVHENIFGVQFHPEKSQKWGLKLLENFVKL